MDQDRFDRITRTLASSQSRRGVLKGLVGSALGGTLAAMGLASGAAKPAGKVAVCHFDATTGLYDSITVPRSAVPAHKKHGDVVCEAPLECCNGLCTHPEAYQHDDSANCGGCGFACASGSACLDGLCIDVQNDPENCGAVRFDCRNVGSCPEEPCFYCKEGSCHPYCDGLEGCADGDCLYECHDPMCGATAGQCRGAHEVCCPIGASGTRDLVACFGPDTCPPDTQRFIGVR